MLGKGVLEENDIELGREGRWKERSGVAVYGEKGTCGEAEVVRERGVEWKLEDRFDCMGEGLWAVGRCGVCIIC